MELELTRETLQFERVVNRGGEQVTIEGEAVLPGSMRDAVTVLGVQAQAHIVSAQAGVGEVLVRGRAQFRALYTQGDLTRVRTLETTCDFETRLALAQVTPSMRADAFAAVQEAQGFAAGGRMTLRAQLDIQTEAIESQERSWIADVSAPAAEHAELQKRRQTVSFCITGRLGENQTLVREEFDLPARLKSAEVLCATATASADEFSGGNGRIGVSGVVQVRVMHRPAEGGAFVATQHELPFELAIDAQLPQDAQLQAEAEVMDVMADSAQTGEGRTLRVEAEVRVTLQLLGQREAELLEDIYSLSGPVLEPQAEEMQIHTWQSHTHTRESLRLQATLSADAPPVGTMLCAFVLPSIAETRPAGKRLDVDGVMSATLIYLPVDSDIPCSVRVREPFSMTFPVEVHGELQVQAYAIEAAPGPSTSDRAEIRCVLGLRAMQHSIRRVRGVTGIEQRPEEKQERGFVLVWPEEGESRWDTARRLRVAQESLRPAGGKALLAFRK